MMTLRASEPEDPTPAVALTQSTSVTTFAPAAELGSQAIAFTRDARWVAGSAGLYIALVVAAVLTLNPYFSQTWDAVTFVNAAQSIFSPDWTKFYALSRAGSVWAYAYPPLHAFLTAPFVALAGFLPAWLLVRVPPMLFDVGLGILLYEIIARKTESRALARLALVVWLLNPVTWYDTAVQGHFEAEWLFFVVLAYWFNDTRRGWLLPTLCLAIATLFKQNALLFALPFWAQMFFSAKLSLRESVGFVRRILANESMRPKQSPTPALENAGYARTMNLPARIIPVLASMLVYALPIAIVSLPFLLASNDFLYMNVQYVADVPLQTQSWLVGLAGIFSPDNFILRESSQITLIAAALIALIGAWRKMSLWLIGTLIVLAFFLLSKKVVGYYYVMILPFSIVTLIPVYRFRLLSLILLASAFIFLSPYFASWTDQTHWWVYALLGTANSILWLGVFIWLISRPSRFFESAKVLTQNPRLPAFLSLALFLAAGSAALLQPIINNPGSPIRAPLIPHGLEAPSALAFLGFIVLTVLAAVLAMRFTSTLAREGRIPAWAYGLVVLLAPVFFLTFTLTKESTAALELALKAIGI